MSSELIRRFHCDRKYCDSVLEVVTGSVSYGTDDSRERQTLYKAGWMDGTANGKACQWFCDVHALEMK